TQYKKDLITLENITINDLAGQIKTYAGNNDSLFANFVFNCTVILKNITNNANYLCSSASYTGAIIGGYPVNANVTFDTCINNGSVRGQYAGFLFGNSNKILDVNNSYVVKNCLNKGVISGTSTSGLFCPGNNLDPQVHATNEAKYAAGFTGSDPSIIVKSVIGATEFGLSNDNKLQIRGTAYNASVAKVTASIKVYLSIHEGTATTTWSF
ncbi:MAG: hypothetical protein RRZ92_04940, partial [Bacilli bacterium]